MPQYIYLYQEHMYIDNLPNGIEGERTFKNRDDALKFFSSGINSVSDFLFCHYNYLRC